MASSLCLMNIENRQESSSWPGLYIFRWRPAKSVTKPVMRGKISSLSPSIFASAMQNTTGQNGWFPTCYTSIRTLLSGYCPEAVNSRLCASLPLPKTAPWTNIRLFDPVLMAKHAISRIACQLSAWQGAAGGGLARNSFQRNAHLFRELKEGQAGPCCFSTRSRGGFLKNERWCHNKNQGGGWISIHDEWIMSVAHSASPPLRMHGTTMQERLGSRNMIFYRDRRQTTGPRKARALRQNRKTFCGPIWSETAHDVWTDLSSPNDKSVRII